MYRLITILFLFELCVNLAAQNPHGLEFKANCAACHSPSGWEIAADHWKEMELLKPKKSKTTGLPLPVDTSLFHHNKTEFPLTGQHASVDCRACHETLVFEEVQMECISCHTDMHQMTAGDDCARCHNTNNWLVDNITDLHQANGFPLIGVHAVADCRQCHGSESSLQFGRIGNNCASCHLQEFESTTNPDHEEAGFSTNCIECHSIENPDWGTEVLDHGFFPLEKGHEVNDCAACHIGGDFNDTPNDCFACHQTEFENTLHPDHQSANFTNDCASCHTIDPSWMPAKYTAHDLEHFPIYSGAHKGNWDDCASCHSNSSDYAVFSCVVCHLNPEMDEAHNIVGGYTYENSACLACHLNGDVDGSFDHNDTNFPLTGGHIGVGCIECHANGYEGTPTDCAACHTTNFQETINPDHEDLGLSTDCASCHTTDPDWMPATFANHNDFYELLGAHADIANDCAACHNGDYTNTPTTCVGCHQDDYDATSDPDHEAVHFSTNCVGCHSETAWEPAATYDHDGLFFPIYSGAHSGKWDACMDCHTNTSNIAEYTCVTCHENPETDDAHMGVDGYSYDSPVCLACHPSGSADIVFNHNLTAFPLTGVHLVTDCLDCHAAGYAGTPTDCAACHQMDFDGAINPDHGALSLSTDCASCHTAEPDWMPATFANHDDYYVLNGAHAAIANDCAACHTGDFNNTPTDCYGCHATDFSETNNPDHVAAQLSTDCTGCHDESAWIPSTLDHNSFYPLVGAHEMIENDCAACHIAGNYTSTPTDCIGCHLDDFNGTNNPDHEAAQFSTTCTDCHTQSSWIPSTFDHNSFYALNGAHAIIANDCAACHLNGDYQNTPNNCFGCHSDDYNATASPDHLAAQFGTDCMICHNETEWMPATFDHDVQYFPIYSGAHNGEWNECLDCHTNPSNYAEFTCVTCHQNPETNDEHAGVGGYVFENTACLACHPTGDITNIFDHNTTAFPLTGAHLMTECLDCHAAGFAGTPTDCAACHQMDFDQTTNPNHVVLGLPTDCASCHTTEPDWMPASFVNHDNFYELLGAHAAIANDCAACHNGNYNNTPNTCNGCHADDYNATTSPDHQAAQMPTDCESCHTQSEWVPSTFDHASFYPFTGAHTLIADDCAACHIGGNYSSTPTECAACHQTHFNQTTNPNHVALALPNDCATCHTTEPDWMPATFDIHDDFYPLIGAHAAIANDCAACHNGDYNNTPNTCFGCHLGDYNNTTNPDHQAAQFSTDCASCHTESEWVPATFDHDGQYFPIYSGQHAGEWDDCVECHTNPSNYAEFSCTVCHLNPETDNAHIIVGGYSYNSPACLVCHPTGSADDPFDHNLTGFPLTGAHISADCLDCHSNGYSGTPTNCDACHQADYDQSTNPNHPAMGLPIDCESCHTTDPGWSPATFAIHDDYWVIDGAHTAVANDCVICHNGDYNNTPNSCAGCHQNDYDQSVNPDHGTLGIPTACDDCHTTNPDWMPASFDIHDNYYQLNGAHAAISNDCAACHNGNYNNTPNTCMGCHNDDYNSATNPDHQAAQFPTDCLECHSETAWIPSTFDHNVIYPLNGAHAIIENDCAQCHINGNYNNTPNTCMGCHDDDYNGTTNPDHQAVQFPTDCTECHTESAWVPSTFDHNVIYPLNGAHAIIENDCAQCHINGNYNNTPNTCMGCHDDDYNGSTNPDHIANQFPITCEDCHSEIAWIPSTLDHNSFYPLTGAHIPIENDCALCHIGGNYNATPNTCDGCHMPDYNSSTNPSHSVLGLPTACDDCHTTDPDWMPATFAIHNNYWPLNGAHAMVNDCVDCHNGDYNNTPTDCYGCHADDYNNAVNPNHAAAQFPTTCEDCHTESAWIPSTFDHNAFYPFTGAHIPIENDCALCHIGGNYNNTPNTCDGCHMPDYNGSTNPSHTALGLPVTCDDCHTTDPNWMPASFDIHNNYWPLNGAHALVNDCAECHNGNYNNTPNTCFGCHQDDYNGTTNPDHAAAQFPTTCEDCHTESAWIPSTFDHDAMYFPIYSGKHDGEWNVCTDCHLGGNYSTFSCIDCHEHDDPVEVGNDHQGVPGYTYSSPACYSCHPTGED